MTLRLFRRLSRYWQNCKSTLVQVQVIPNSFLETWQAAGVAVLLRSIVSYMRFMTQRS